jgi:hypothetical protein
MDGKSAKTAQAVLAEEHHPELPPFSALSTALTVAAATPGEEAEHVLAALH